MCVPYIWQIFSIYMWKIFSMYALQISYFQHIAGHLRQYCKAYYLFSAVMTFFTAILTLTGVNVQNVKGVKVKRVYWGEASCKLFLFAGERLQNLTWGQGPDGRSGEAFFGGNNIFSWPWQEKMWKMKKWYKYIQRIYTF